MADFLKVLCPQDHHQEFLLKGVRSDGRRLDEFRSPVVQMNIISTAFGSAMIRQGDSLIIASVHGELGRPKSDSHNRGRAEINVHQSIARDFGQELRSTHQLDNNFCADSLQVILDNGVLIDLDDLSLENGTICWVLKCDLLILEGLASLDGCLIALSAAFNSTTLPKVVVKSDHTDSPVENGDISKDPDFENLFTPEKIEVDMGERRALKMNHSKPIASSFMLLRLPGGGKSNDNSMAGVSEASILADPSTEEIRALHIVGKTGMANFIVGENHRLCGVYLTGIGQISNDDLFDTCIPLADTRRELANRLITEASAK